MKYLTTFRNLIARNSTPILLTIIAVFAGGSMLMTAAESVSTKQVALSTHGIVESQATILTAIKQAELDNSITATQKTNIIICMLQVPQSQRIPKEADCRKQAANSDTSSKTFQGISGVQPRASSGKSSSNNAPKSSATQPSNSQSSSKQPLQILGVKSCVLSLCVEH